MIGRVLLSFTLLALLVYGVFGAWPLIVGPDISLTSPKSALSTDGFFSVAGNAKHAETLYMNGVLVLLDTEGNFSKELLLPKGGSILTLVATDRFGRSVSETRTLYSL